MSRFVDTRPTARVAVFAHTPVLAAGLSDLLRGTEGTEVVGETTALSGLVPLIEDRAARVVVAEVDVSDDPSRLFDLVRGADPRTDRPVTVVCVIPSRAGVALDLKRRGAAAVVVTTDDPEALREAVLTATSAPAPATSVSDTGVATPARAALTARELDVLQGMVDGYSSRMIAENLGVTVNTVRTHVQRLLPKLGAHNRLRAAAVAIDLGLVTPSTTRLRPPVGC